LENYHIYTNKVKYIGYYEDIYRVISYLHSWNKIHRLLWDYL